MHERAPVGMEVAKLLAELGDAAASPSTVTVAVAADVDLDIARDAWESAADGTLLAGIPVEWVVQPALLVCLSCERQYPGGKLDRCPECGGDGLIVENPPTVEALSWSLPTP